MVHRMDLHAKQKCLRWPRLVLVNIEYLRLAHSLLELLSSVGR